MKTRFLRVAAVGLALAAFVAASAPAQAGSLKWTDDAGDAVGLGLADGPANDPAFDITKVTIATDGGKLTWAAEVPEMPAGRPTLSTGYNFRFGFTHAGAPYWFQIGENALGEVTLSLATASTPATTVECKDCKATMDRESKTAAIVAPLASLDAGLKAIEAAPASGAEWGTLFVIAQRRVGAPAVVSSGATLTADTADAPEGTTFTL